MSSAPRNIGHAIERVVRTFFVALSWFCLAVATLVVARAISDAAGIHRLTAIYLAAAIVLVLKLVFIAMHELGHAGVAAALGWRVPMLLAGPVAIKFRPMRIIVSAPVRGAWLSGGTYVSPPESDKSAAEFIAISLGGPVVNIAAGLLIIVSARWLGARDVIHSPAEILGILSALMGIASLAPAGFRSGSRNDGGNIVEYLRGVDLEARGTLQRAHEAIIRGVRPRDWDPAMVALLIEKAKISHGGQEAMLLYMYYFDCDDVANARLSLNRAIGAMGAADSLLVADAFFSAFAENDLARARACLDSVRVKRGRYFATAEAIVKVSEGDLAGGAQCVRLARKGLRRWPFATACDWDILDQIDARISNAAAAQRRDSLGPRASSPAFSAMMLCL